MRHTLRTEVDIAATPDEVWRCLTDFGDYPAWNPFITAVQGVAAVGQRLTVRLDPPGGRGITIRPT
ncbi:MAG TPA: SRPBCC family protein, partial [Actinoplanes sp.]